jgi:hypothetical protein
MMWLGLIKSSEGLNRNFSTKSQKSDWIQIRILHMSQCLNHNFCVRYRIAIKLVELES